MVAPEEIHLWMKYALGLQYELDGVGLEEVVQHVRVGLVEVGSDHSNPNLVLMLQEKLVGLR
ncbi:hypothetical protein D3C75_1262370 [compost metagenome]